MSRIEAGNIPTGKVTELSIHLDNLVTFTERLAHLIFGIKYLVACLDGFKNAFLVPVPQSCIAYTEQLFYLRLGKHPLLTGRFHHGAKFILGTADKFIRECLQVCGIHFHFHVGFTIVEDIE